MKSIHVILICVLLSICASFMPAFSKSNTTSKDEVTQNGLIVASDFELPDLSPGDIYAIKPDGTGKSYLTHSKANGKASGSPAWSFDGMKVAYGSNQGGGNLNIWTMDANGDNPKQMTSSGGLSPAFSPDGSSDNPNWSSDGSIIFVSNRVTGTVQTWIINADGSNPRVLLSSNYGGGRNPWRK